MESILNFGGEDYNLSLSRNYLDRVKNFMKAYHYPEWERANIDGLIEYLKTTRPTALPSASVMIAVALDKLGMMQQLVTRRHGISAALNYATFLNHTEIADFLREFLAPAISSSSSSSSSGAAPTRSGQAASKARREG